MAVTGGFCPLPLRLGGDAATGMTAEQHARACADMVAVKRTARFCVFDWAVSGGVVTVTGYRGMNGVGAAHAPTVLSYAANVVTIRWATMRFSDSYQVAAPFLPRHAAAHLTRATFGRATHVLLTDGIEIRAFDAAGGAIADPFTGSCEIW